MSRLYGSSMVDQVNVVNESLKELINNYIKSDEMDLFDNLDSETGALLGGTISLVNDYMKLLETQARTTDYMADEISELKRIDRDLVKQNNELLEIVRNIKSELTE